MKKLIIFLTFVFGFVINAYAGGVQSDNEGTEGYVLVATGENHGADSRGVWTDSSFLKGEKGDTGEQGIQGVAGQNGGNGFQGEQGAKGDKGDKGEQGIAGQNGTNGEVGATGAQGEHGADVDPEIVNNINNNITNTNNAVANTNSRIDDVNNRVGRLEKPQAIVGLVARIQDSRKWQTNLFIDYSATRNAVSMYGIRFTYKMGRSYEERRLDELEAKLDRANRTNETLEREASAIPYVTPNGIGIRDSRKF